MLSHNGMITVHLQKEKVAKVVFCRMLLWTKHLALNYLDIAISIEMIMFLLDGDWTK